MFHWQSRSRSLSLPWSGWPASASETRTLLGSTQDSVQNLSAKNKQLNKILRVTPGLFRPTEQFILVGFVNQCRRPLPAPRVNWWFNTSFLVISGLSGRFRPALHPDVSQSGPVGVLWLGCLPAQPETRNPDEELIILEQKRELLYLECNRQPKGHPLLKLGVAATMELNSFPRKYLKPGGPINSISRSCYNSLNSFIPPW